MTVRERVACSLALITAAVVISAPAAWAQRVVNGTVVSGDHRVPVVAAEVTTIPSGAHTRTDDRGRFRIAAPQGDTLRVRALGFHERRVLADSSGIEVRLTVVPVVLPKITTTVGGREIRLSETAAAVSVVGAPELAAAGAVSVNQLLRQLPGLQETPSQPSRTTIAIRGLDAQRVLMLIDGEPVAGALSDLRDVGRLSAAGTERIEVTKGPSSVEFGSDALGGVINVVTAAPAPRFVADVTTRVGAMGRAEATGTLSDTRGRFGYRATGGWRQVDRIAAISAEGTSFERVYDARADLRYTAGRVLWRANAQWARERQRWPAGGGFNGFVDTHTLQGFTEAVGAVGGGSLRARVFGQLFDYQFRQARGPSPIAGSADSLEQREQLVRATVAYTRVAGAHTIDVGTQLSANSIVAPGKIEGDSADNTTLEAFLRDSWSIGDVLVNAGGRATHSSAWGDALTPSLGVVWSVAPSWRMRANVARGFRGPSFKEMRYTFSNPNAGYVVVGNAALDPESSVSTEAGVAWGPSSSFGIELGVYRNELRDLIDTRFVSTNAAGFQVYQNINVARARTEGFEMSTRALRGPYEASATYAWLRARNLETGEPLDRRAAHSGRVHVSREWPALSGVTTDVGAWYTGVAPIGDTEQGAMLSVDGSVRIDINSRLELSLGVNNALDRRPAQWSTTHQRQVYAGARMRFGEGS
jgi:outer membrane receptor for ferrienterochelin and colicins